MISLKPTLEIPPRICPNCDSTLAATNILITGMRNLADFRCVNCRSKFFGDLPAGQALYTPILLNKKTGATSGGEDAEWFSDWLVESYKNRSSEPLGFEIREFLEVKNQVVLLNCLDTLYGHSLLKLLNAQYYLDYQIDKSLILIVPPFLEWLIPDGTAQAWIVDLPLRRGTQWNDWLANEINKRLESFEEVYLSEAFSHPHFEDFDIERFTRIEPFPLENFAEAEENPAITFIWREDRLWETAKNSGILKRRFGVSKEKTDEQAGKIIRFAEHLRGKFPKLDFAVAGLGKTGDFPQWMMDLRLTKLDAAAERAWCKRYAKSHIVVGVHGSNMLLPSAHAGGVIEIIGISRFGNYLQDILFRPSDAREMFFRYRFVPHSFTPEELAELAATMLRYEDFRRLMSPEFMRKSEH